MDTNKIIGARIKQRREQLEMTQEELGNLLSLNKSTINRYESGEVQKIKIPILHALSKALDVDPNWLALKSDDMGSFPEQNIYKYENNISLNSAISIPVLGKVSAGIPITAVENIIDYEEIPSSMAETGEYVALQIKGSSMEPRMFEGDVVIIKVQPTVDSGDIAVVIVNGNEATVKKVQLRSDGIVLQPFNSAYDPMFYTNEDIERIPVRIFGKVVECRQKY